MRRRSCIFFICQYLSTAVQKHRTVLQKHCKSLWFYFRNVLSFSFRTLTNGCLFNHRHSVIHKKIIKPKTHKATCNPHQSNTEAFYFMAVLSSARGSGCREILVVFTAIIGYDCLCEICSSQDLCYSSYPNLTQCFEWCHSSHTRLGLGATGLSMEGVELDRGYLTHCSRLPEAMATWGHTSCSTHNQKCLVWSLIQMQAGK